MASTANEVNYDANSEANEQTRSTDGGDTSDTTRDQQEAPGGQESHQGVCRLFTPPPEVRAMIFGFVCTEYLQIKLPGPLPTDITTLMLASKEASWRAEVYEAIWKNCWIEWRGSLNTRAWQRFKKTAIPRIMCLTIDFKLTEWFDLYSDIRQTLAWMWQRSKRGNQARYPWYLEQLHLRGVTKYARGPYDYSEWCDFSTIENPRPGRLHWSRDFALERLRPFGIKVTLEVKHLRAGG